METMHTKNELNRYLARVVQKIGILRQKKNIESHDTEGMWCETVR